jgi:hypothetical protein
VNKVTPGHTYLRRWFAALIKAHEADAMAMTRQQLNHILSGRRKPTLVQAVAIYQHTGCAVHLWN